MTLIFSSACRSSRGGTQTAHEIFIRPLLFSVDGFEVNKKISKVSAVFTAETRILVSAVNTAETFEIFLLTSKPSTEKSKGRIKIS